MAVTIISFTQTSRLTWRLVYSSSLGGTPTFSIYRGGELIVQTEATQWDLSISEGEVPVIEVLDDSSSPSAAFPGHMTIGWRKVADTAEYVIQEFVDAAWVTRRRIIDNGGAYFSYRTRFLEASIVHQYRVVPVATSGEQGLPVTFSGLMRRHPDPPLFDYAYDPGTQKVTITEAA